MQVCLDYGPLKRSSLVIAYEPSQPSFLLLFPFMVSCLDEQAIQ